MNLSPEMLNDFFERYGWTYSRESDDTWITGVRTRVSAFRIMVRMTEHWVFFIINPFVVAPPDDKDRLRVYYHALRYNLDMNFAKLGIDSDGDIFMAVEMPTEGFGYSHFVDALDGLSHHASMIYAELFGLAHNPSGVSGRYDDELERKSYSSYQEELMPDEEDDDQDAAALSLDDVIIGGRRLKIFDDNGKMRVELEGSSDEETEDDSKDQEKPKKASDSDTPDSASAPTAD